MTTFDCNEGSHTFFCQWPQNRLRLHFYFCTLYNKKEPYFLYCLSSLNISVTDLEGIFFDGDTSLSSAVSIRFSGQLLTNVRWSSLVQTDIQKFFFLFFFFTDDEQVSAVWGATLGVLLQKLEVLQILDVQSLTGLTERQNQWIYVPASSSPSSALSIARGWMALHAKKTKINKWKILWRRDRGQRQ